METATLALLLSILNLLFLLYTNSTNRRSEQLQKLAAIRTKLSSLKFNVRAFLMDLEIFWDSIERVDQGSIEEGEQFLDELEKLEATLKIVFDGQSGLSLFSFPTGRIENIEHQLDTAVLRFDVLIKGMLPRMKEIHLAQKSE